MASCLEARGRDVVTRFLAENPLWIEHYLGLLQYPRFEEYIDVAYIEGASPQYEMVHGMSVVRKAQCAVLVGEGKGHDCLLILAEDVRMARRVLDGARSLAGKIAAEKLLRVDYQFLAELVAARPDAARQHAALINEMLAPLTAQEQDMSKVLMERVYFGKTFHKDILKINGQTETERICAFLKDQLRLLHRSVLVIGLSGGIDSALSSATTMLTLIDRCTRMLRATSPPGSRTRCRPR